MTVNTLTVGGRGSRMLKRSATICLVLIGYSDTSFATQDHGLTQADRTIFAKIGYAWVF